MPRDDVVHQHVHLRRQNVDEIGLLLGQNELLLQLRLVAIGAHLVDMHPDVMMQIEMEHQNVGMNRNLREEVFRNLGAQFGELVLGGEAVAFSRLAQKMAKHVAGRFQREAARRERRLVIDEPRLAAARREHDHILARPVGVAMRGVGVFRMEARASARELRAIAPAPIEIGLGGGVESLEQSRRFAQKSLGGEDLADRAAGRVAGHDADHVGLQGSLGVGLDLEDDLAGLVVRGRNVIEARHHIGKRLRRDIRRKEPAALAAGYEIAHQRGKEVFEIGRLEAPPLGIESAAQRRELRGARVQLRTGAAIQVFEEVELRAGQSHQIELDALAEAKLRLQSRALGKFGDQRLHMRLVDLDAHHCPRLLSG